MSNPTLWKITCMEDDNPGLWQLWLKHQCVSVGYGPRWGYKMEGGKSKPDWTRARGGLKGIELRDYVVAALPDRRIGRIGEVVSKEVDDDQWNPPLQMTRRAGKVEGY